MNPLIPMICSGVYLLRLIQTSFSRSKCAKSSQINRTTSRGSLQLSYTHFSVIAGRTVIRAVSLMRPSDQKTFTS